MKRFLPVAAIAALLTCGALQAEPKVLIQAERSDTDRTLSIRSEQGASCTAPTAGACGSCAISCPVGQAAECKPGRVVGDPHSTQASCLEAPACACR